MTGPVLDLTELARGRTGSVGARECLVKAFLKAYKKSEMLQGISPNFYRPVQLVFDQQLLFLNHIIIAFYCRLDHCRSI